MAAVEVRNLRKTYGHIVAVDDLSSTIDYGEAFALLGPNGAGKSTAVRLLVFGFLWSLSYTLWPTERPAEAPWPLLRAVPGSAGARLWRRCWGW